MRSAKAYDNEHVTKPVKMTVNVPYESEGDFVSKVTARYPDRRAARLLLVDGTGEAGVAVAEVLRGEYGYEQVFGVVGGYEAWMRQYTTSGRRRIQGTFVSSGKEALKSGLNLDAAVASTYEENHGRPELSMPSNRVVD